MNSQKKAAWRNGELPVDERIADLIGQMTLEEKVRQMDMYLGRTFVDKTHPGKPNAMAHDASIMWDVVEETIGDLGIGCLSGLYGSAEVNNALQKYAVEKTRLGIPMLFGAEALHGFSKPGCTIFPQAIGLSGTWNPELVEKVGHAIAAEGRSAGVHEVWSPVIDLARDPRWGRMEETHGEDTFLSGRMAAAMVRGMQGDDVSAPDRLVSEPKHFVGYGNPAGGLNCAPTPVGERELRAFYLPVFEAAIVESGAMNVMCSYNSIDGVPCAENRKLLTGVLREEWGMRGFVRSDLGAVARLHSMHFTADSEKEAIRRAVEAGVDMQFFDFSHEAWQNTLIELVREGDMSEETIDRAVYRILRVKFELGLFENPYTDTERQRHVIHCVEHQNIALQTARESICLMKNEGGLLPLARNIKSIAVIGPGADEARFGDYSSVPDGWEPVTLLDGIREMVSPQTEIIFERGMGIMPEESEVIPAEWLSHRDGEKGLLGEYFNNHELDGEPVSVRSDICINFNWQRTKPCDRVGSDNFSVRWTGAMTPDRDFDGLLGMPGIDSVRLWIDDEPFIDAWGKPDAPRRALFNFKAGKSYDLRLEYRKDRKGTPVKFVWSYIYSDEDIGRAAKAAARADVAVVALADSEETCGEGSDRAVLNLPGRQCDLLRAVHATGAPAILLLQTGRANVLTWEAENIPAIVAAWFPGEKGGRAMAEVLFGEYNPAGRLPVSFPRAEGQIPVCYNRMPGGSEEYIEMDWSPQFAFGHGLSYTTFEYSDLKIQPAIISPDGEAEVSFRVTNTGDRDGDEVAQLYIRDCYSSVVRPVRELRNFRRLRLRAGQSEEVIFKLGFNELKLLNRDMEWVVESGLFKLMVGGGSDAIALEGELEVE